MENSENPFLLFQKPTHIYPVLKLVLFRILQILIHLQAAGRIFLKRRYHLLHKCFILS